MRPSGEIGGVKPGGATRSGDTRPDIAGAPGLGAGYGIGTNMSYCRFPLPLPLGVNPAQIATGDLAASKVAKITRRITGIGNGHVAQRRAPAANQPQHVPGLRGRRVQGVISTLFDDSYHLGDCEVINIDAQICYVTGGLRT